MNHKYIITNIKNQTMGFHLIDGKTDSITCYQEDSIVGNVYMGRISNIVENIGAIFVDIKNGESCYLAMEDYIPEKKPRVDDLVLVQVVKDRIKTKQANVTTNISITGDYVIVQANGVVGASNKSKSIAEKENKKEFVRQIINDFDNTKKCIDIHYGAIIRTEAFQVSEEELKKETVRLLCQLDDMINLSKYSKSYSCLLHKESKYVADAMFYNRTADAAVITDLQEVYDHIIDTLNNAAGLDHVTLYKDESISLASLYNLNVAVDKALSQKAFLKSGAYLVIEPTEAMVVIDVNSGKAIKGKCSEEAILKINMEAAKEIARQLRIRNLSGMILIDFISMKSSANNDILMEELRKEVLFDRIPTLVVDMTKLGIVEVTRKKLHKPIYEIIRL
ncbi:MAG: ribonuclease E/G [Wujia sp.]